MTQQWNMLKELRLWKAALEGFAIIHSSWNVWNFWINSRREFCRFSHFSDWFDSLWQPTTFQKKLSGLYTFQIFSLGTCCLKDSNHGSSAFLLPCLGFLRTPFLDWHPFCMSSSSFDLVSVHLSGENPSLCHSLRTICSVCSSLRWRQSHVPLHGLYLKFESWGLLVLVWFLSCLTFPLTW